MLVNGTKNITFDLKINYRIVQSIQFFSNKMVTQLLFLDEYYKDYFDNLNGNIGHNISFYELFLKLKNEFLQLRTQSTLYIKVNPNIYVEQMYLNHIIPLVKSSFQLFSFFIYYFSVFFYGSLIVEFSFDTYEIIETGSIIDIDKNNGGIFNLMNKNNTYYLSVTLNIFSKLFQDFYSFFISLFSKLDNRSEYISNVTQILIPNFIKQIDNITNILQISYFDLEIIRNDDITNIFSKEISLRFRNRINTIYLLLKEFEKNLSDILNLL